jgi:hypothetical protein
VASGTTTSRVQRLARHAWLWAALYIVLIPVMAVVYVALGEGAFFDSNLTREAGFTSDRTHLEESLSKEIDRAVLARHARWSAGSAQFHFDALPTVSQIMQPAVAKPSLVVRVSSSFSSRHVAAGGPKWFVIELNGISEISPAGSISSTFGVEATGPYGVGASAVVEQEVPTDVLFPPQQAGYQPRLVVTGQVAEAMQSLYHAYAGDPSHISGLFGRMLYFSATIATTLGLGDIQPVSGHARNAVTVEAVLGILFAGLFLNAIARRRGSAGDND